MRQLCAVLALVAAVLTPSVASAHPLGNFTVNHYSRIEPARDRVRVFYVLDMAEIPTFQEKPAIDAGPDAFADQRAESIRQNLHLSLDGQPATLVMEARSLSFPAGQGGLPTLRLEATYSATFHSADVVKLVYRDDNDPTRIGWREIVARPGAAGTVLQQSTVSTKDVTDGLRKYPDDLLTSPLDIRQAQLQFVPVSAAEPASSFASASGFAASAGALGSTSGMVAAGAPFASLSGNAVLDRTRGAFADLANGAELTPAFILFAIGVAILLGMAHALQPGHGKTVVAAYLVGSRGTPRHALFLGATVTATHTAGVYALGLVTLLLSQYILPERLYPVLEIISGGLVIAIGVWLFGRRLLSALGWRQDHGHTHEHDHAHDHGHAHDHVHTDNHGHAHDHVHTDNHAYAHDHPHAAERVSWRSLLALGVSGGLLPCPEALMVLLITIAAHRVLFGLLLIVSFSTGLAAVLVGFGLLLVYARGLFARVNLSSGLLPRLLPVASALVIVVAGGVITAQALPQVL